MQSWTRRLAIAAMLMPSSFLIAGEPPDAKSPRARLVELIQQRVPCRNAAEVAATVDREGIGFEGPANEDIGFQALDLGDGTRVFIFAPPPGNGQWAQRPEYHFVLEDEELRLLFDSRGAATRYDTHGPKWNGRYLLTRTFPFENSDAPDVEHSLHEEVLFWKGSAYVQAYTDILSDQDEWAFRWAGRAVEQAFRDAHVTWTVRVGPDDSLSRLSRRLSTSQDEVMRQNSITDPDVLRLEQILTYDSKKTNQGRHRPFVDDRPHLRPR